MSRILLIEDETSTQNLLQNRLRDLGHEVDVESTGARGILRARERRYDLHLVDIGLGSGIDGFEVCRRLKKTPQLVGIPVVLISGQVKSQEDLHRGYEAGCESFLVKGDLTLMEDVVRAMLRIKSLQDDLSLQNRLLEQQNRRLHEERQRGSDLESALREVNSSRGLVFRELAAGRPDGTILVDGEGHARFADRGARDILGNDILDKSVGTLARGTGLEAFVRDARTEPREGYRFDLGHRSLSASVIPLVPRAGANDRPYKVLLLLDAGRRRVAAEMLRMEEQGLPRRELGPLLEAARRTFHPSAYPGDSAPARELRARLSKLALADAPVLVRGEVGTGQEWVARALHFGGPRSGVFIPVNCCALDPELLERELFGFEKGTFPEAIADRPGVFEQADNGTVLLTSIEALPAGLQGKLIEVLESGRVYRIGSSVPQRVNVRVVTSSTVDLEARVEAGSFNPDLFYLLNRSELRIPPLRERRDDVLLQARLHLQHHGTLTPELDFSQEVLWVLARYEWPGNDRELENCVESACAVAVSERIEVTDLPPTLVDLFRRLTAGGEGPPPAPAGVEPGAALPRYIPGRPVPAPSDSGQEIPLDPAAYERMYLVRALRETGGDKRKAARILKMGKSTFYRKLARHNIVWTREQAAM